MRKLLLLLLSLTPVILLIKFSKKIILPGFQGMHLYEVLVFFIQGLRKGTLTMRASAVSFNFFLAIFPSIIFIFTLIPYIPIENFQEHLLGLLKNFMPYNAYETTRETIEDIIINQRGGLLSVGFLSAMYFSTNGINSLITAFNNTYHVVETRTPFQQRMISIVLVIIITLLITIATALIITSEVVLNRLFFKGQFLFYLIRIGRWVIVFALFYTLISFIYFLAPSRETRWRFTSAGSMLATLLSIVTSLGFAFYVNNFGNYNKLYGSIGTLIVILLWLYINSLVLLVGFDLNASIYHAKRDSTANNTSIV